MAVIPMPKPVVTKPGTIPAQGIPRTANPIIRRNPPAGSSGAVDPGFGIGKSNPVTRIPTPPPSGPIMGINPPGKAPIRKPSPPPPSMASNLNKISRGNSGSGTPSPQLRRAEAEKQKSSANNSIAGNLRNIPRGESSGSMSGNLNRAGNAAAKRRKAKQLALKKMAANRG